MILNDNEIAVLSFADDRPIVHPFRGYETSNRGEISRGLTSFGYDLCLDSYFHVLDRPTSLLGRLREWIAGPKVLDPKNVDPSLYREVIASEFLDIAPHSFALGMSAEFLHIPDDIVGVCLGKSTYARCFSGDTRVKLVDGTSPTLKEMADEYLTSGKHYYGFGVKDRQFIAQKLVAPRKVGREKVLVVTLDNGRQIKCTPDHMFCLRSGGSKRADKLIRGESLMPLYSGLAQGYERVWDPFARRYLPVSRMVDEMLVREGSLPNRSDREDIHHKDGNRRNNNPTNLERIDESEHARLHNQEKDLSGQAKKYWTDPENKRKHLRLLRTPEAIRKAGDSRSIFYQSEAGKQTSAVAKRKMWETRGEEGRKRQAEVMRRNRTRTDVTEEALTVALLETGTVRGAAKKLNVDRSAFKRFPEVLKRFKEGRLQNNHAVAIVSRIRETEEDVYCLTAPETGNFALDAGVFVHNCGLNVNITPLEPGWKGRLTIELTNSTPHYLRVYVREGIAQILFFRGSRPCRTYAEKSGIYQNQTDVTLPRVKS